MPCIFNIKKEDRCCQYCSAVCDERQPKPVETFTTNLQYFGEVSKEEKTKMDSTQEGPTTEIDFEQELYKAFGQVKDFTLGMRIAKWFYDMGKNSQDPVSEDLEKVADQYSQGIESDYTNDMFDRGDIYEAVIYGAQWQKQQMMKDAVEGYIERDKGGQLILGRTNFGAGDEFMLLDASTFHDIKCGDRRKAKIMIIIKED